MSELHLDQILAFAVSNRASDIHFQVGACADMRVDGSLRPLRDFGIIDAHDMEHLLLPILTEEQGKEFNKNWELDFSYAIKEIGRFRVNFYRQMGEMGAAMRHIPDKIPNLAQIFAPMPLLDLSRLERGLVLITGPTGSGKSTTLAAMIDVINSERSDHILTLEDPIEFVHSRKRSLLNQREIGKDSRSFAEGLKRALRQDPDVILVGEMRDPETTAIAITAAETGHLVLSTLHTRSASSTVDRIIDQFPAAGQNQIRTQLSNSLAGIVSQTLLPRADGEGRVPAHEVLLANSAVENIIRKGNTEQLRAVLQTSAESGMQTMDKALAHLVQVGMVDLEVARRRSQEKHEFDQVMEAYRQGQPVQIPRYVTASDLTVGMQGHGHAEERPAAGPQMKMAVAKPAAVTAPAAQVSVCPLHDVPIETPLQFDEESGRRYPHGTTHRECLNRQQRPPAAPMRPPAAPAPDELEEPHPAQMHPAAPAAAVAEETAPAQMMRPASVPAAASPAAPAPATNDEPAPPAFKFG